VRLTAFGNDDEMMQISKFIIIHPYPIAYFQLFPNFQFTGKALQIDNLTTNRTSSGMPYDVWYLWDWGDNSEVDTDRLPSHVYNTPGNYSITLTVGTYTDPQCVTSILKPVEITPVGVLPGGEAKFTLLSNDVDLGQTRAYGLNGSIIISTPDNTSVQFSGTAELIAMPKAGNVFIKWDDGNTDNPRTVMITKEDVTYTAIFEICVECEDCLPGTQMSSFEMQALSPLTVFPNPAGNIINVQFENHVHNGALILYDLNGRTVFSQSVSGFAAQIDLSHLATGSYVLRLVENGAASAGVKVIKN